jgi:hypothetical protein
MLVLKARLPFVTNCYISLAQNFLFTTRDESAPMKLIDFGLSDFIRPGNVLIFTLYMGHVFTIISALVIKSHYFVQRLILVF